MTQPDHHPSLPDTGERMIPTLDGEISIVFARHLFTYEFASQFVHGKKVLDVGCGTGYGAGVLAKSAGWVHGVDRDPEAVAYSKERFSTGNIQFTQGEASGLSFQDEFDVAISFQVIEHLHDVDDFVIRIKSAVRPGGLVLLTTPNARTKGILPPDNPFHVNEMTYREFSQLLARHFTSCEVLGIGYAAPNRLRSFVQRSPLYTLGKFVKRGSRIKKIAAKALSLTRYAVIKSNVERDAIDLLAVCRKE